jgi:hypothetical protein
MSVHTASIHWPDPAAPVTAFTPETYRLSWRARRQRDMAGGGGPEAQAGDPRRGGGPARAAAHAASAARPHGRAPELSGAFEAGFFGRRLRVPRLRRAARAAPHRAEPGDGAADHRGAPARHRAAGIEPRGRRPDGVITRDRGRSPARGGSAVFETAVFEPRSGRSRVERSLTGGGRLPGWAVHTSYPLPPSPRSPRASPP